MCFFKSPIFSLRPPFSPLVSYTVPTFPILLQVNIKMSARKREIDRICYRGYKGREKEKRNLAHFDVHELWNNVINEFLEYLLVFHDFQVCNEEKGQQKRGINNFEICRGRFFFFSI